MFTIGIDPRKGSHVAAALDHREVVVGEVRVRADVTSVIGGCRSRRSLRRECGRD
jgi:hypothetical protein